MDAATTERFVQRFLDGMQYETERTAPPEGFPKLSEHPGGRYRDPTFLAAERQALWKRTWLYACHVDELPDAGSFMLWTRTGSPILIVRGKDLRDPRVLQHLPPSRRAAGEDGDAARCDGLVCSLPRLDLRARRPADQPARQARLRRISTPATHSLVAVRCEQFANWVFVNEDPNAQPLLENIAPVPGALRAVPAGDPALRATRRATTSSATSRCCSTRSSRSIT